MAPFPLPQPGALLPLQCLQSPLAALPGPQLLFPLHLFHPITSTPDGGATHNRPGEHDNFRRYLLPFLFLLVLWNKHNLLGVARGSEVADLLPLTGYVVHHFKIDLYYLPSLLT